MDHDQLERRRKELTRTYEIASESRFEVLGWGPGDNVVQKVSSFIARTLERQFLPHYFGSPPGWRLALRRLGGERSSPDFFVIGAPKGGTSDLAINLMLHPNVIAPLSKEPQRPDQLELSHLKLHYPTKKQKERHARRNGGVAKSPYLAPYIHSKNLIQWVGQLDSDRKVVLPLRQPVKRFYSQWKWEVFLSGKSKVAKTPALQNFSAFVDDALDCFPTNNMYTKSGLSPLQTSIYWKSVQLWIEELGRDNILVTDVGNCFRDRNQGLSRIQEFVGLPVVKMPKFKGRTNANPLPLPPPDEESLAKLEAFFQPFNERLWDVIGEEFDW